jgi:glycosyltransferase involved in cell wall biosynthesis
MYLIVTHIPIYLSGSRTFVDNGWYADLILAREFFAPHFGEIHVAGPSLSANQAGTLSLHEIAPETHGMQLHPSVDARVRTRMFWLRARREWLADLETLLRAATVVHASVDDPFRPFSLLALLRAAELGKPIVQVGPDMDPWITLDYQRKQMGRTQGYKQVARTIGLDRWIVHCARRAAVTMLKEGAVYDRYASYARNPKSFCHTMHRASWVIDGEVLDARLATLSEARPLRLIYCGRFVQYKGLSDSLRVVARCRELGADVTLDMIGAGEQRTELEALVRRLGLQRQVRFFEFVPYGPELFSMLRGYDALLYTPLQEDTARMVYDAFACGLPVLGTDIPFLKCRANLDQALVLWPIGDVEAGAQAVARLDADRERLRCLSSLARLAGVRHTVEYWYGRRTEWTRQLFESEPGREGT